MTLRFNGTVMELLWTCPNCGEKNINTDWCQFCGTEKTEEKETKEEE